MICHSDRGGTREVETSHWRLTVTNARAKPPGSPSTGKPRSSVPPWPCREGQGREKRRPLIMVKPPPVGRQLYPGRGHTFNVPGVVASSAGGLSKPDPLRS